MGRVTEDSKCPRKVDPSTPTVTSLPNRRRRRELNGEWSVPRLLLVWPLTGSSESHLVQTLGETRTGGVGTKTTVGRVTGEVLDLP